MCYSYYCYSVSGVPGMVKSDFTPPALQYTEIVDIEHNAKEITTSKAVRMHHKITETDGGFILELYYEIMTGLLTTPVEIKKEAITAFKEYANKIATDKGKKLKPIDNSVITTNIVTGGVYVIAWLISIEGEVQFEEE